MSDTEEITAEGITNDYAWRELTIVANECRALADRVQKLDKVLKARDYERNDYFHYLETQVKELKAEVELLRSNNG